MAKNAVDLAAYEKQLKNLTPKEKQLREQDLLVLKSHGIILGKYIRAKKVFEVRIAGEEEVGPHFADAEALERATAEAGLAKKLTQNPASFEETTHELKNNLELAPVKH